MALVMFVLDGSQVKFIAHWIHLIFLKLGGCLMGEIVTIAQHAVCYRSIRNSKLTGQIILAAVASQSCNLLLI